MKRPLIRFITSVMAVGVFTAGQAHAVPLTNDNFSYPDGALTNVSGGTWVAFSGVSALNVSNGQAIVTSANTQDAGLAIGGGSHSNDILFVGFDVTVTALPPPVGPSYFLLLKDATTSSFMARVWTTNEAGSVAFGIGNTASGNPSSQPTFWPSSVSSGSTHRIIIKLDQTGPSAVSTLWLDAMDASAPNITATDAPTLTNLDITSVALRQNVGGGTELVDNLKVGTAFADVVGPSTNSWTGGSGKWELGANWSLNTPPVSNQTVLITNSITKTVTIDSTTDTNLTGLNMTISNLTVSAPVNSTNTLLLTDAAVFVPFRVINVLTIGTNGVMLITNSTVQCFSMNDGGNVVLNTGTFVATNNFTVSYIGGSSDGQMTVSNGTCQFNQLEVGFFLTHGTLTFAGGTNTILSSLTVEDSYATGAVWITGGQLTATNDFTVIGNYQGSGQMTISNGTWRAKDVRVGNDVGSYGTLTVAGGTNAMIGPLNVGGVAGSTGTLWITGGQLVVTNTPASVGEDIRFIVDGSVKLTNGSSIVVSNNIDTVIGNVGSGSLTVFGGSMQVSLFRIGNLAGSRGTVTASGGTITCLASFDGIELGKLAGSTGTFWLTGGRLVMTTNAATVVGDGGVGQMTLSNGTALLQSVYVGFGTGSSGTLTVAGGEFVVTNAANVGLIDVRRGSMAINGGTVTVDQLFVTNGAAGGFSLNGGTLNTKSTTINKGSQTVVGDGTSAAVYNMVAGGSGFHNFNVGGLAVTNNAELTGCGTISGDVVVDPGGTVMAGCGTALYFDNGTVTNYGTIIATGGTVLTFYNPVVNAGTIDATGGNVHFFSTVTDTGTILTPTNSWTDGTAKWETAANWSLAVAPTNTQAAILITNAGNKTVTIDATTSGSSSGTMTIRNLNVAGFGTSTNTLALSNAGLAVPLHVRNQLTLSNNSAVVVNNSALQVDGVLGLGSPVGSGNQLVITNGGRLVSDATVIGGLPGFNNSVLVIGTNSVWANATNNLVVANSSGGIAIKVANGASLTATNVFLGNSATADGNIVIVTDAGSLWTNTGALFVGGSTHHTQFIVSNGAAAYSASATIGNPSGTTNSALVTGSNSLWRTDGSIRVGRGGIGDSLTVTDGGSLIASNAAHTGLVTIDGATLVLGDGTFKSDNLVVTNAGVVQYALTYHVDNGTITVAGGTVEAGSNLVIATTAGSTGTVIVVGGTLVNTNGALSVGNDGTSTSGGGVGLLVVSNGTLQATTILIGSSAGGQGDLIVGNGGTISCPAGTNCLMEINSLGTDVYEGGDLEWYNSTLECGVVAPGDFNVSGGQAPIEDLYIGFGNTGTMTMAGGLVTITSRLIVGHSGTPLATGVVWIKGGQLTVANNYSIIGNSGVGQMTISNGTVTVADVLIGLSSNPGTLTLAGGTLTANGIVLPNPSSRFVFSSGWLNCKAITNANGQTATAGNGSTAAMLDLMGGISTFDKALTISAVATLSGVGTVSGGVINYGLVSPSGGALNFTGGTFTNYGTVVAPAGSTINFNGPVVNNGMIITNSAVHFNGGLFNNSTLLDAAADSDGDGMNNADEALAGTNPLNSTSVFRILTVAREGNDLRVTWSAVGGKRYIVQTSPGTSGSYSNNFTDLSSTMPMAGAGESTTSYLDSAGATNAPARYYRVRLVP